MDNHRIIFRNSQQIFAIFSAPRMLARVLAALRETQTISWRIKRLISETKYTHL
jgi:hypothetical protein